MRLIIKLKLHLLNLQWFRVLGASFSRFRGLRFRSRGLCFRDLGASFSRFGCFVLRSSFSSASFSKLPFTKPHRKCSKVILHDYTCNIINHFERDKRHGFRFVPLLKIVLKFFLSDRMVY